MAYCKILNISCANDYFKTAVNYAVNPDKTILERMKIAEGYAIDPDKTEIDEVRYASCINLSGLENAADEMIETKERWGKMDGRLGYHVIQSFSPDDNVTPEMAHEIGKRYAEKLFGDFEVVIGTHVDKSHIHNHIVINSVSCIDGHKLHTPKGYLRNVMRKVSDRYCEEYSLSVIPWTSNREMSQYEWYKRHWREGSFKEGINLDIRDAAAGASSKAAMLIRLENKGYQINSTGKHTTIKPPDGQKFWRLNKFYTDEEILTMTEGGGMAQASTANVIRLGRQYRTTQQKTPKPHRLTRFDCMYLQWLRILGEQRLYPRRRGYVPPGEYRKAAAYRRQLKFTGENNLTKLSQVVLLREELQAESKHLNVERYRLTGRKKKYQKLFDAHRLVSRLQPIIEDVPKDTQDEYAEAIGILKKSGYDENSLGKVEQIRVELETAILENTQKRVEIREKLKLCGEVEKSTEKIPPVLDKDRWEQKDRINRKREHINENHIKQEREKGTAR